MSRKPIEFACPDCKRPCRLSEKQRAVQHSDPVCRTWRDHKTKGHMQEFLRLALVAAGGSPLNAAQLTLADSAHDTAAIVTVKQAP